MSEGVLLALVAGGSGVAGSLITGWFTYYSAVRQRQAEKYKRKLVRTLNDVMAFYNLEELYTDVLSAEVRTAEAWKKDMRAKLRDTKGLTLSRYTTPLEVERELIELN